MRDLEDEDNNYDYGPNEMAEMSIRNKPLYDKIMHQNIGDDREIQEWKDNNHRNAQESLAHQRRERERREMRQSNNF